MQGWFPQKLMEIQNAGVPKKRIKKCCYEILNANMITWKECWKLFMDQHAEKRILEGISKQTRILNNKFKDNVDNDIT